MKLRPLSPPFGHDPATAAVIREYRSRPGRTLTLLEYRRAVHHPDAAYPRNHMLRWNARKRPKR